MRGQFPRGHKWQNQHQNIWAKSTYNDDSWANRDFPSIIFGTLGVNKMLKKFSSIGKLFMHETDDCWVGEHVDTFLCRLFINSVEGPTTHYSLHTLTNKWKIVRIWFDLSFLFAMAWPIEPHSTTENGEKLIFLRWRIWRGWFLPLEMNFFAGK